MAFSIAALVADGRTKILDSHCIDVPIRDFMMHLNIFYKKTRALHPTKTKCPFSILYILLTDQIKFDDFRVKIFIRIDQWFIFLTVI